METYLRIENYNRWCRFMFSDAQAPVETSSWGECSFCLPTLLSAGTIITAALHIFCAIVGEYRSEVQISTDPSVPSFHDTDHPTHSRPAGAGVLSLPHSMAQLGWVAGPIMIILFYVVSTLTAQYVGWWVDFCQCDRVGPSGAVSAAPPTARACPEWSPYKSCG